MEIKKARQILKSLADDTRLRIVNLLEKQELTVNELCLLLDKKQPNVSKHLTRLRLTEIVRDRRSGNKVFYFIPKTAGEKHNRLPKAIMKELSGMERFKRDEMRLKELIKKKTRQRREIMKKLLVACVAITAVILSFGMNGASFAQETDSDWVYGEIVSVSGNRITVSETEYNEDTGEKIETETIYAANPDMETENITSIQELKGGETVDIEYVEVDGKKQITYLYVYIEEE